MDNTNTEERELTFGEKAVGLTFNPSGDENVTKAKKLCAELIDLLHDTKTPISDPEGHKNVFLKLAILEVLGAQMWAVKALTWKD